MGKIRVLHVLEGMRKGGAEAVVMNLYRNVDRSRVQFDFMVHTTDKCAYDDEILGLGGRIFRVPLYNVINHLTYKKAWHDFFKNNADNYKVIHAHMISLASIYLKIASKYGLKTIAHSHNMGAIKDLKRFILDMWKIPLKHIADYLFACSLAAGEWIFGKDHCKNPNFFVLNNGINTEKFIYNQAVREQKRKEFDIENKFVVGHIGRFATQKNHSFLIDIFKSIYEKNNNAALLLVGEGELRDPIKDKVRALGLEASVIFTGVRSDISDLLCAMDVFLFPSLYEGLGIVLIEAQANGLHCITSDVVPQEAKVTKLIEYVSLNESASHWADKIFLLAKGYKRQNMQEEITQAGFEIKKVAKWTEEFYLDA